MDDGVIQGGHTFQSGVNRSGRPFAETGAPVLEDCLELLAEVRKRVERGDAQIPPIFLFTLRGLLQRFGHGSFPDPLRREIEWVLLGGGHGDSEAIRPAGRGVPAQHQ